MKRPSKPVMIRNSQQINVIVTNEGSKYVSFKKALKTTEGLLKESYDNGVALDSIKKKMNYATITRRNGTEIIGKLTGDNEYDAGNESLEFDIVPNNSDSLLELSKTNEIVSIAKVKFQSFSYDDYNGPNLGGD